METPIEEYKTYSVRVEDPLAEAIEKAVKDKLYVSISDLIRTALRAELAKNKAEAKEGFD